MSTLPRCDDFYRRQPTSILVVSPPMPRRQGCSPGRPPPLPSLSLVRPVITDSTPRPPDDAAERCPIGGSGCRGVAGPAFPEGRSAVWGSWVAARSRPSTARRSRPAAPCRSRSHSSRARWLATAHARWSKGCCCTSRTIAARSGFMTWIVSLTHTRAAGSCNSAQPVRSTCPPYFCAAMRVPRTGRCPPLQWGIRRWNRWPHLDSLRAFRAGIPTGA